MTNNLSDLEQFNLVDPSIKPATEEGFDDISLSMEADKTNQHEKETENEKTTTTTPEEVVTTVDVEETKKENGISNGKCEGEEEGDHDNGGDHDNDEVIKPNSYLPKPAAPPGLFRTVSDAEEPKHLERSVSLSVDVPAIGKFLRERSNSLSAALAKRISSLKENNGSDVSPEVTEIHLSGLKVIVQTKTRDDDDDREISFRGRISFFSRSNCRDCGAVRSFFREKGLRFVEINIDVYRSREKELVERTGSATVPQIFFNEKLIGGLVVLNSLRNGGEFDKRVREMLGRKCPESAPAVPVYGFDDPEDVNEATDEMIGIVRVLRHRLPIQDRLTKMKIVKNCFSGTEMVDVMIQHLDCGRKKAIEIGKEIARKHFIHHVFGENDFEDGNHFYRFLEHEAFILKCFNFRGATNDCEPKSAAVVGQRLTKIMSAALESYASEDRQHVDYTGISNSEEFRRYVNLAQDLQRCDILALSLDERLAFFLNLYNAMVIHAIIRVGCPDGIIDQRSIYGDFQYIVGGRPYSLNAIKNGILRSNRRQPYSLVKPFGNGDRRLEVALPKVNQLIHFGLCNGTRSSPKVQFFSAQGVEAELRCAAREFFSGGGIEVDLGKRNVYLSRIIKWFNADFGQEKDILKWIISYLDSTKAGLLTHLLSDGGPVNIVYQKYDWSLNT